MNASNDLIARLNPSSMADKHINALATGRDQEIERILRTVRANRDTPSAPNEHLLIRGQRGMGKSFLLRWSQIRLQQEPELIFVLLPEELPNVHSPEAWLTEVYNRLSSSSNNPNLAQWQYQENANAWEQRLQQILRCLEQEHAKTLLLIGVENIDRLLASAFKDKAAQSCLRHLLENEKRIMLLASSLDSHLDHDYDARLFHNFHSLTLAPWQASDHSAYLKARARYANINPDTVADSRIKAYSHFTDGSPRIATVLTNLLLNKSDVRDSATHLPALVDEMSEYYQELHRLIPPQAAKLFDALLRSGEPCSQSELARRVGAQQNQISRHFVWLRDADYISALERVKGQTSIRCQVRDRIFAQFYRIRFFDQNRDKNSLVGLADLLADRYELNARRQQAQHFMRWLNSLNVSENKAEFTFAGAIELNGRSGKNIAWGIGSIARIDWRETTPEQAWQLWDGYDKYLSSNRKPKTYALSARQQLADMVFYRARHTSADAALATCSALCNGLRSRKHLPQEQTLRTWLLYWLASQIDIALLRRLSALIGAEFGLSVQALCATVNAAVNYRVGDKNSASWQKLDPDMVTTAKALVDLAQLRRVFIGYSNQDKKWRESLQKRIEILELEGHFSNFDDNPINPVADQLPTIERRLHEADIAIIIISANFLTSNFIRTKEIPTLLRSREQQGMRLIPLILEPCAWRETLELDFMRGGGKDDVPLSSLSQAKQEKALAKLAGEIASILDRPTIFPIAKQTITISDRLPTVKGKFFGRKEELQLLDAAWHSEQSTIVEFVALGGTGKTKLLRHWLDRSLANKAMGINAVIAWSFYSQGASEDRQISTSDFFAHAFAKLGSPRTDFSSEEDRGEYLAELLNQHRCLLILDGLEPLQHASSANRGELKDRALRQLLRTLALNNQGLCVITTRIAVHDLSDHQRQIVHHNLDNLKVEDAVKLLKNFKVQGTDEELRTAAKEYNCHALSVSLLGNLLHRRQGGDIRKRDLIPDLVDSDSVDRDSRHAFKVMQAYERWFSESKQHSAELALLRLLGLFDQPIEQSVLQILQQEQIPELTAGINLNAWSNAISALRDDHHLLAQANDPQDDQLDCHPIIRAYFAHQLQNQSPNAWQAAHAQLYEYYKNLPNKYQPDTLAEMQPLFRAVAHGCATGFHQQALDDVYYPRIQRSDQHYLTRQLGAFSDDLATLAHFFTTPWHAPAADLTEDAKAVALSWAGAYLRALGRLREAQQPMRASEDMSVKQEDWKGAAQDASNLSELQLTLGEVQSAVASAELSVFHADRSEDLFQRMINRTTHADALHQYGELDAALALFQEAEELQRQYEPEYPRLYSLRGFHYCDLLLAMGESQQVMERAKYALDLSKKFLGKGLALLDIALDHVSLGRAHLQQQQIDLAQQHLDQAVDDLRKAGQQDDLPLGLLARAELYRQQSNYKQAEKDLQEVFEIAERGEMQLHLCDYHLAMAKLLRTRTDQDQNQPAITHHLQSAEKIIHQTHYHRRLPELKQLLNTKL